MANSKKFDSKSMQGQRRFSARLKEKKDLDGVVPLRRSARLKLLRQKEQDVNSAKQISRCSKLKNDVEESAPLRSSRHKEECKVLRAKPSCRMKPKRLDENNVAQQEQNVSMTKLYSRSPKVQRGKEEQDKSDMCPKLKKKLGVDNEAPTKQSTFNGRGFSSEHKRGKDMTQRSFGLHLKKKTVRFDSIVRKEQAVFYNRKIQQPWLILRPRDLCNIEEWLNHFKMNEMTVHPDSQHLTKLCKVAHYPRHHKL